MTYSDKLKCTIEAIDQANLQDPNEETVGHQSLPKEYAYSQHMTRWLFALDPDPSERMQIACRAQHIERWTMPCSDYGEGRKNYLLCCLLYTSPSPRD